jgi:hypothetical protein
MNRAFGETGRTSEKAGRLEKGIQLNRIVLEEVVWRRTLRSGTMSGCV